MLEDKKVHDIFAHADLDNEDWLQPSDEVFEGVETVIYPKKRVRWFWFLLPLIFTLGGGGIYYYWSLPNEKSLVENQVVSKDSSKLDSDLVSSKLTTKTMLKDKDNFDTSPKKIEVPSNKKNENSYKQNAEPFNKEKINKRIVQPDTKSVIKKPTENLLRITETNQIPSKEAFPKNGISIAANKSNLYFNDLVNKNSRLAQSDKPILSTPTIYKHSKPAIPLAEESKIIPIKSYKNNITQALNRLALREHSLTNESQWAFLKNSHFNILPKPSKQWQYEFSSGFSAFNLRLNQAFSKFLKPKNFEQKVGKGFFVSAGILKKWNTSISIHANVQYEQVVFQSSHYAIKLYDIEEEITDQTNIINVEMASPLGFANSDLTIKRTHDLVNQTTEFAINLNNRHQIFAVDAGVGLSAQFINFVKLRAETVFYTGIHQLLFVKYRLRSFQTNHTDFAPLENSPLSRQSQLQQTRPYIGLGLQFYYQIKTTQGIRFKYVFKQDVLPLYKESTYRSLLNRQQVGLSYVVQF